MNNIPKEKNSYDNTISNYALIDNNLSAAQRAIGESSNLAQICLTYTYNFDDQKYIDYVCILSVVAQCAIDNAKRRFDIDLTGEIDRIKKDMEITKHQYPKFWSIIRKGFNENKINEDLICPMNYIYDINIGKFRSNDETLPMSDFFVKYPLDVHRRKSKKVEELIESYSLNLLSHNIEQDDDYDQCLLLREDFDNLINSIRQIYVSKTYLGLMSWLIDRAFMITPDVRRNWIALQSTIAKNRSILLKTLYEVNPKEFLKCFAKNIEKSGHLAS